jgi:very-short-patch-repair endonuclease
VPLLGTFIVDFLAPGPRVVVEVDGGYHGSKVRCRADGRRDRRLNKAGFVVVRLSAQLVVEDADQAVSIIARALRHPQVA